MNRHDLPSLRSILIASIAATSLAACSTPSINVWPFGGDKTTERSRVPANASEYVCNAGKRFYVRQLDSGNAVWLILPEREVRLDKTGTANRFSNGVAVLELNGNDASLTDGTVSYAACKKPEPKP